MDTKKMRGFTLIELFTVISIIIILVGLLSPALQKARQQAKEQKAEAEIGSLEIAVNMYYTDYGNYPSNLSVLTQSSGYGPYIETKSLTDPWEIAYNYIQPGYKNVNTFDVWSNGLNKTNENTGGLDTGDDIGNW